MAFLFVGIVAGLMGGSNLRGLCFSPLLWTKKGDAISAPPYFFIHSPLLFEKQRQLLQEEYIRSIRSVTFGKDCACTDDSSACLPDKFFHC